MHFHRVLAAAALAAACLFTAAEADPITYTLTGTASGTLGTTSFATTSFTWTITGDTADAVGSYPLFGVPGLTDSIMLSGIGTADPTNEMFTLDTGFGLLGFTDSHLGEATTFGAPSLVGYDGVSSVGPVSVGELSSEAVFTNQGKLRFRNLTGLTFQATVSAVPEPATLALFGAGLLGVGFWWRKRKAKG